MCESMNHSNSLDYISDSQNHSPPPTVAQKTFILPETVQFGYHETTHSKQMTVSEDGLSATKVYPDSHYAHGVCYGATPLKGTTEFEVEITSYGTGWSGTMKLGIMRCKSDTDFSNTVPRYSPEAPNHCVWSSSKLHNRLTGNSIVPETEKPYGLVNMDELRVGRRVGLRLTGDGVLNFFVDGKNQGVAAENIYLKGHDVYVVVDHYANCKATRITRAAIGIELNLEDMCTQRIASIISQKKGADPRKLPLPVRLIDRVVQYLHKS